MKSSFIQQRLTKLINVAKVRLELFWSLLKQCESPKFFHPTECFCNGFSLKRYNLSSQDFTVCKRRIELEKLAGFIISTVCDEMVIHVPEEYDYKLLTVIFVVFFSC